MRSIVPQVLPQPELSAEDLAELALLPGPGGLSRSTTRRRPPTVEELRTEERLTGGWDEFTVAEAGTAQALADRDLHVVAVRRRTSPGYRSPDAYAPAFDRTIEFKQLRAGSINAVAQNLRDARRQSRLAVLDARATDLSRADALAGLDHGLQRYGDELDEVLLLASDFELHWPQRR